MFAERLRIRHMHPRSTSETPAPSKKGSITIHERDEYEFRSPASVRSASHTGGSGFALGGGLALGSGITMGTPGAMADVQEEEEEEEESGGDASADEGATQGVAEQGSSSGSVGGGKPEEEGEVGAPEAKAGPEGAGAPLTPSGAAKGGKQDGKDDGDEVEEGRHGEGDPELGLMRERRPTILIVVTVCASRRPASCCASP